MKTMTEAPENMKVGKKASKPLMEKKRRARINKSLNQLKGLLENEYFSNVRKRKLEKADILELTVKHLRNLQTSERGSSAGSAEYEAGYSRCLSGVSRYILSSEPGHEPRSIFLTRLTNTLSRPHITNCPLLDSTSPHKTESRQNTPDKSFKNGSKLKKQQTRQQMTSFRQCGSFPEAIKQNYWRPW